MCGIFGLFKNDQITLDIKKIGLQSSEFLRHRGPDDEGYLLYQSSNQNAVACSGLNTIESLDFPLLNQIGDDNSNLILVHRRLSILDLSDSGHQPMRSKNGRYWIVFNGEIYNYIEMRDELISKGYTFRSESDTEVLLNAYDCWGENMLNRLVGMFSFCILDKNTNMLFLARDHFGIKPLYYLQKDDVFAFSSEIKPLLNLPGTSRKVCPESLYAYLRYGVTDQEDKTFFENIFQLRPGHCCTMKLDVSRKLLLRQYWSLDINRKTRLSFDDAAAELRHHILENIRLHLRSDVPVGACLSGGIDSSAIVMGMRKQVGTNLDLKVFGYVAEKTVLNEEQWMDLIACEAFADIKKVRFEFSDLVNDVDKLIDVQEEPFGSTSIYAQYRVFSLANENGIKVMLDGQGADELFGGYLPYAAARIATLAKELSFSRACKLWSAAQKIGVPRSLLLSRTTGFLLPSFLRQAVRNVTSSNLLLPWVNVKWFADRNIDVGDAFHKDGNQILRQDLALSLTKTNLPMLLKYEDRNSMAFSIESRVPYLTSALAEFVFSLPEEYLINDQALTKSILRKSLRGLVPDIVLDRRDKIGFATPEKSMLTALVPWVEDILSSDAAHRTIPIQLQAARQEWYDIYREKKPFSFRIWRILNTIKWVEKFDVKLN